MGQVGRPTKYEARFASQAKKLCLLGATNDDLAEFFEVSPATIDNWIREHPRFLGAIKRSRAAADARVARRLYERAMGYSHPAVKIMQHEGVPIEVPYTERYPPDTVACIFWLKNRQPKKWRDKQEVEHSGTVNLAERLTKAVERARKAKGE